MKYTAWVLALPLTFACAAEARAQYVPYGYGGGYYNSGDVFGFSYRRRSLSISGLFGGFAGSRFGGGYFIDPFGPPPLIIENRIIVKYPDGPPPQRRPSLQEELAGVDLDLAPSKKPPAAEPAPPAPKPPAPLPGEDVSKPKPPVRPAPEPEPKAKPPEPKKELPRLPEPPPPKADPKEENARLVNLGLAAFGEQEYGLAAHRFRQATVVEPKSARAWFLLAQAEFALGKYRQAVEAIHDGMRRHKDWPRAPFQPRTDLYKGIEPDLDAQMKRLEAALAADPDRPTFLFLRAYEVWFDGPDGPERAAPLFRRARPFTPDPTFIDQFLAAAPRKVAAR